MEAQIPFLGNGLAILELEALQFLVVELGVEVAVV